MVNPLVYRRILAPQASVVGTTLLLDTYTGAAAAYSLRKLRTAYSGNCIRVRRSSDDAEADIGFSGNALDTAALESHCGAGNGFIVTWYDQAGSLNVTQSTSTKQPQIVSSGTVDTSLTYDGTDDALVTASATIDLSAVSAFAYIPTYVTGGNRAIVGQESSGFEWRKNTNDKMEVLDEAQESIGVSTTAISGASIVSATYNDTSGAYAFRLNGSADGSGTNTSTIIARRLGIGGNSAGTGEYWSGKIAEVVIWASVLSGDDIAGIEANMNSHYSVY